MKLPFVSRAVLEDKVNRCAFWEKAAHSALDICETLLDRREDLCADYEALRENANLNTFLRAALRKLGVARAEARWGGNLKPHRRHVDPAAD